jgi:hypothetical protein
MSKKANLYVGRAGQMAVISEFLIRGWNVAVPEVDIGDDLLVIKDQNMDVSRIQVKTASASKLKDGYSARYSVRLSQLSQPITPEITYIFVTRLNSRWESFLVIPREVLYDQYETYQAGSLTKAGQVSFYFSYLNETVTCCKRDFSTYLNNWSAWPVIEH